MIVADTSWVAAIRDPEDAHHVAATASLKALGDESIVLAPLTLAECLVGPARMGEAEVAEAALRAAFEVCEDGPDSPRRWAQVRADTGLKLPDAVVLDTAQQRAASAIATFDLRLAAVAAEAGINVIGPII